MSLHKFLHLAAQTRRVGPFIYVTQWTLERTIGILGSRIRQPSKPYQNLSKQCIQQAQCQALRSIDTTLMEKRMLRTLPKGALELGGSFALLRASEPAVFTDGPERDVTLNYLRQLHTEVELSAWNGNFTKWARLQLPNGERVRT
ncbi:hypothetical protein BT69DRAFT_1220775 [Atractiella rhizophila]|nr:hypothetical protein BT69DRAFT_1220775 [Atractiella rhizophila]